MRKFLLILIYACLAVVSLGVQTKIGSMTVDVITDPATIPVGRANLLISIKDASGKPVEGAQVSAIARMPNMNMGEREQPGAPGAKPGEYVASAIFSMAGAYKVTVTVNGEEGVVDLSTGQSTGPDSGGSPLVAALPWLAALALGIYVLARVRKTGQKVNVEGIFNRQVLGALVVLGGALGVAIWAINTQRRPGSMTPIESQAMEMNTPAPDGTLAVTLATATTRDLESTVTYSGQVMGFVEQDILPRVPGRIETIAVYVGDKVRKGQLLARLDTSQLDPEVDMRSAAVGKAEKGVGVATLEYDMALKEVQQARAEVGMARGDVDEARAMLDAAIQGRSIAEADLRGAEADVASMQAELASAEADRAYMQAEFKRSEELFKKGAISRDELQMSRAGAEKAEAMVRLANEKIRKARSMVASSRAMQRKVEAEIAAAQRKVQQSEAGLRAKQAMVRTAESAAAASKAKIGQERDMVREYAAGLRGATTQRGYAELRSDIDGVVTQRVLSPGQIVSAGQAILKVAQVSPVRLQANVPESDLARIYVGASVKATAGTTTVDTRVSSVAPSVDSVARTGMVEALFENANGEFRPGQFVRLELSAGGELSATVVPFSAISREAVTEGGVNASSTKAYVWVAQPGMNGEFTVKRQVVTLGARSGGLVSIKSGIVPGQKVVSSPTNDLKDGSRVTVVADPTVEAKARQTVIVTADGYEPSSIVVPANESLTITFIRKVDPSCGDTLVFPTLKITKNLPLNVPTEVTLPPQAAGELKFHCGMDMYRGQVIVK